MKKFFVVGFLSLLLVGCGKQIPRYSISSLEDLKFAIIHVYVQLKDGDITKEYASEQISYLQKNYGSYFSISTGYLASGFSILSGSVRALPIWAAELGLVEPVGMKLDAKHSSKTSVQDPKYGFDSFVLVYTGSYDHAMQEAKRIADLAKIPVSPEIAMAQEIQLSSGIVYTNHGLLDTDIDYLISVSADEQGLLILDVTNYKQITNKKK